MYNIKFIRENLEFQASPGINLLEAERKAGLMPDAPCGGQGKCGKCRVKIDGKVVLACKTVVDRDSQRRCHLCFGSQHYNRQSFRSYQSLCRRGGTPGDSKRGTGEWTCSKRSPGQNR